MPTVPPQSSPFAAILSAVLTRLSASLSIDPAYLYPVASADYPLPQAEDFFVVVQVFEPVPTNPATGEPLPDGGAGRSPRTVGRFLRTYVYTRQGVDSSGTDPTALMGDTPTADYTQVTSVLAGHLLREEQVLNSLDDFAPYDVTGSVDLALGTIHWTTRNEAPERKPEDDAGIIRSVLNFQVVYNLAQNPTEPSP